MGWCSQGAPAGMFLAWLFLAGLIIAGVVVIVRATASGRQAPPEERSRAIAILEERFARGEIDRDEYVARSDALAR